MKLRGQTAVITGAGSGIGLASARLFAAEGARVIAVDVRGDRLRELPAGCVAVVADVSEPAGCDRVVAAAGERLDVLLNNAGILDRMLLAAEVPEEEWDRVLAVNLTAPFLLCRRALPRMLDRGGGVIVNTASLSALRGGRAGAAYTASKFGLAGLTLNIAATYGGRGIRCNAICPGAVETGILGEAPLGPHAPALRERDRQKPPPAQPEQIAEVALFLATPAASYLNGALIPVDGGASAF